MKRTLDEKVVDRLVRTSQVVERPFQDKKEEVEEVAEEIFRLDSDVVYSSILNLLFGAGNYNEFANVGKEELVLAIEELDDDGLFALKQMLNLDRSKTASFTPETDINGEAETPWSFNKDKNEIGRKSHNKEFLTLEEVDDICPSCAKRMHARGITKVSAKEFARQLKRRKGQEQVEEEGMGDVWKLETSEQDAASDELNMIIEDAMKGDIKLQELLEVVFEEKWPSAKEKLETEGSVWYVWYMDGVNKYLGMKKEAK